MTRLGVLGGTFDPIHIGHLVAAVDVRHALDLDRVLLVVAGDPWQKRGDVTAPAAERLALARAVVAGIAGLEVSAIEVERTGPTYTADTLDALRASERGADLFLIVGADTAAGIGTWARVDDIASGSTLVVVNRPGHAVGRPTGFERFEAVEIPHMDVSSTAIRARLAAGRPIDGLVPVEGVHFIRDRRLYPGTG